MKIYSGSCCLCDVGIKTGEVDMEGNELYSGDIVQLWHGNYVGTELEEWLPCSELTAIVGDQYQSFSDGSITTLTDNPELYTMGIAKCGVQNHEWKVMLVKSHKDIIENERLPTYGFIYKKD